MKEYSAIAKVPGKCHLIDEYGVVWGEPAIIAAINMYARISANRSDRVTIHAKDLGIEKSFTVEDVRSFVDNVNGLWQKCSQKEEKDKFKELRYHLSKEEIYPLKAFVGKSLEKLNIDDGINININSEIPRGAGLGSSAALSVGIPAVISKAYDQSLSDDEINKIAYEIEKINHGTPSGGDNATCCYGGLIWFQKPSTIEKLKVSYPLKNFVIVQTKKGEKERSTQTMIDGVRNLESECRDPRIKAMGNATYRMRKSLKSGNFKDVEELMNSAQSILAELKVSTPEIDVISESVKRIGGAAKITGAGGEGGCVVCHHENKRILIDLLQDLGYKKPWNVELGVRGLQLN
jgi:mevalonate kinase